MTTTQIDTQTYAAGNGGQSTPVKLLLQPFTNRFALELQVATTRTLAPSAQPTSTNDRKAFRLYWATSYQNLASGWQNALRHLVGQRDLILSRDQVLESVQIHDRPKGQYLYAWVDHPQSLDAYTFYLTSTEVFINAGAGGGLLAVTAASTLQAGYTTVAGTGAGGTTQKLPAAPGLGATVKIKNADVSALTVSGNGNNIYANGSATTYNLTPGETETFAWDGTYWQLI